MQDKYVITVAKADGLNWQNQPHYKWFCSINAGDVRSHAQRVEQTLRTAFPSPEYSLTLQERVEYANVVEGF